jgi:hypothetical protein
MFRKKKKILKICCIEENLSLNNIKNEMFDKDKV